MTQIRKTNLTYEEEAWESAWKGRARGLWTGIAMGIAIGGAIGALAALSTMLAGVPMAAALALVLPVAKVFALTGMGMGMLTGTECGAVSGAAAKAMRQGMCEPALHDAPPAKKKLFNGKVALTGIVGGLVVGALIVSAGGVGAIGAAAVGVGAAAHAAAACVTMAGCALMGSIFGIDLPSVSRKLSSFMGGILSGETFEHKNAPAAKPEIAQEITISEAPVLPGKIRKIIESRRASNFTDYIANQKHIGCMAR